MYCKVWSVLLEGFVSYTKFTLRYYYTRVMTRIERYFHDAKIDFYITRFHIFSFSFSFVGMLGCCWSEQHNRRRKAQNRTKTDVILIYKTLHSFQYLPFVGVCSNSDSKRDCQTVRQAQHGTAPEAHINLWQYRALQLCIWIFLVLHTLFLLHMNNNKQKKKTIGKNINNNNNKYVFIDCVTKITHRRHSNSQEKMRKHTHIDIMLMCARPHGLFSYWNYFDSLRIVVHM